MLFNVTLFNSDKRSVYKCQINRYSDLLLWQSKFFLLNPASIDVKSGITYLDYHEIVVQILD